VELPAQGQRLFLHCVSHSGASEPPDGLRFSDLTVGADYIVDKVGDAGFVVLDRDNAGGLLDSFRAVAAGKRSFVALCSCSSGEMMPRSSDWPPDPFTACLTTPAKVALIWHSRNYFCFSTGPLHPLPIGLADDLTRDRQAKLDKILTEVATVLRATVEAIALRVLDENEFARLFRREPIVGRLFVNFVFASHVLNCFGVHPVSLPDIPDLSHAREWHTFDLRLDVALYEWSTDQPLYDLSYRSFLSQTLISMGNVVSAQTFRRDFPFELAFVSEILVNLPDNQSVCSVLAKYLDGSGTAAYYCLFFPIAKRLFCRLGKRPSDAETDIVVFCLVKILAYSKAASDELFVDQDKEPLNHLFHQVIDRYRHDKPNLSLVLLFLALLFRNWKQLQAGQIPPQRTFDEILRSIRTAGPKALVGDLVIWFLFWSSSLVCHWQLNIGVNIGQIGSFYDVVHTMVTIVSGPSETRFSAELQFALIDALGGFIPGPSGPVRTAENAIIKQRKRIEKEAIADALSFRHSAFFVVRRALFSLVTKFRTKYAGSIQKAKRPFPEVRQFFEDYKHDPDPRPHPVGESDPTISISLLDTYSSLLLRPILPMISDPPVPFGTLLRRRPTTTTLGNPTRPVVYAEVDVESFVIEAQAPMSYAHACPTRSDLIRLPGQHMGFGDERGNVVVKKWAARTMAGQLQVSSGAIVDLTYVKNCGSPMLFAASDAGNCYCLRVAANWELTQEIAFKAFKVEGPSPIRQAVAEGPMVLYSWVHGRSREFVRRDLVSDRLLTSLQPSDGAAAGIYVFDNYSVVATVSSVFELWDLRSGLAKPVISRELGGPAFAIRPFDKDAGPPCNFAIATASPQVCFLDITKPEGALTRPVYFVNDSSLVRTKAFDVMPMVAAIGYDSGIVGMTKQGIQNTHPTIRSSGRPNVSSLLWHDSEKKLAVVHDGSHVTVSQVTEKKKKGK
jgi:hypothetical protein